MAFTYTDRNTKTVLHSWGRFKAVLGEAAVAGDLLGLSGSSASTAMVLADDSDGIAAVAVVCEDGSSGDTVTCALAAELKAPVTLSSGGAATQTYFADSTDYLGSPLYLGESGKVEETVGGTTAQVVGFLSARDRIVLTPGGSITGGAGNFSTLAASGAVALSTTLAVTGNTTVGGTLEVTGASTLTGAAAINGGATVASTKTLTLTKGNVVMTEGNVAFTKGQVIEPINDGTDKDQTLDNSWGTVICEITEDTELTLPTAAAGLRYTAIHKSGAYYLSVHAGTSDKIIDPADGGAHDYLKDDKGLDCHITLVAADDTNWVCTSLNGDWTGANDT